MKIVINTPAGNIGRKLTRRLLEAGHELTLISRNPDKVQDFVRAGARLVRGSIDDEAVLDRAFAGAEALFWLPPLVFDQPDFLGWARATGRLAAATAARHHIERCVLISSVGAQHEEGVGPIACMGAMERAFAAAVPNLVSLRCGHFMENFAMHLPTLLSQGAFYSPHPTDLRLPFVATRDIAAVAARWLEDDTFRGNKMVGVHGPEDLSHREAAAQIGTVIGRSIEHVEVPVAAAVEGMRRAGVPHHVAELLGGLYEGIRTGRVVRAEPRTGETTTPTTLATFTRESLLPLFEGRQAA
jgi:uncharacterized protein YbjT (DUF2867 family)